MDKVDFDITREIPSKKVIDLGLFEFPLNTKEGFTNAVKELGCSKDLPRFFPNIPDVSNKLSRPNVAMNTVACEDLLNLPHELYDSDIYNKNLVLRVPMEEIILANENERLKSGFGKNYIKGKNWSESFKKRFDALHPKPGPVERKFNDEIGKEASLKHLELQGRKIA